MTNGNQNYETIEKYDRILGGLKDIAQFARATTIKNFETLTGKAETFVIMMARHAEMGDYAFIEQIDEKMQVTRVYLPPKAIDALFRQRISLGKKLRSIASRATMKARMEAGYVPTPPKRKAKGKKQ